MEAPNIHIQKGHRDPHHRPRRRDQRNRSPSHGRNLAPSRPTAELLTALLPPARRMAASPSSPQGRKPAPVCTAVERCFQSSATTTWLCLSLRSTATCSSQASQRRAASGLSDLITSENDRDQKETLPRAFLIPLVKTFHLDGTLEEVFR